MIYLFFSIAIGIGFGAGQTLVTLLVFILIILTIYFFGSKKTTMANIDYNLLIEIPYGKNQRPKQDEVIKIIKKIFNNYNVSKIEIDDDIKLLIVIEISSSEIEKISEFESNIKSKYDNSKISYFENRVLT